MPLNPAVNANANGMCSWGLGIWTKSNAHGPRLKAGGLIGLRDTIRYKRLEVFLEALSAFVQCVTHVLSYRVSIQVAGHYCSEPLAFFVAIHYSRQEQTFER
jgi:hypothetical protein